LIKIIQKFFVSARGSRVWIDDARKRMDTISYITDKVKEEFDKEGIEIPYPKRDITITYKK